MDSHLPRQFCLWQNRRISQILRLLPPPSTICLNCKAIPVTNCARMRFFLAAVACDFSPATSRRKIFNFFRRAAGSFALQKTPVRFLKNQHPWSPFTPSTTIYGLRWGFSTVWRAAWQREGEVYIEKEPVVHRSLLAYVFRMGVYRGTDGRGMRRHRRVVSSCD